MIPYKQLSLADIFSDCHEKFENDKPAFLSLLETHIDIDELIPISFRNHFYASTGRTRKYPLQAFLWALIIQRIFSIPTDQLLLTFLAYSKSLREFCGFTKVPDASKITRFKQDFLDDLQLVFDNLVDVTEPICQAIDSAKADMTIFDSSGIEAFVTENNPKYANRIIKQLMEICGEAEDGEEALKKILEEKPDILIMDINIPYMNGIEVSKKVKVIFPEIQVIILTAYGEFEYAREALSFGAVSFVLKPLDPEELTKELQKCKEKLEHIYRQKSSVKKMQKDQFLLEQLSGMVPSENQQSKWEEMKIPFDKPLSVALIRPENKQQNNKMAEEMEEIIQDYFPVYEMISMNQGYAFILLLYQHF